MDVYRKFVILVNNVIHNAIIKSAHAHHGFSVAGKHLVGTRLDTGNYFTNRC